MSLDSERNARLALQRANVIRYVAGHPGLTTAEIARGVGMKPQACGQVLHKNDLRKDKRGRWYAR